MKLVECIQTKNPSYSPRQRPITPVGIIVHTTAANNPYVKRYVDFPSEFGINLYGNHWNKATAKKSMHAFIGYDKNKEVVVAHTLPYNLACWGAGLGSKGSQNYNPQAHIQFEICEDNRQNINYYKQAFGAAEEYCAYLCKTLNISPNAIIGHYEAHQKGIANNHSDPRPWMSNFGDSMNAFRARVAARLAQVPAPKPTDTEAVVDNSAVNSKHVIKMQITREENAAHYKVPLNTIVHLDLEAYVKGVVPSEIGNASLEAAKAQAVASRTIAVYWTRNGATITDASSSHQAFRAPRAVDARYVNAHKAVAETSGEVLYYNGKIAQTYYAHSNGGNTINNKERWTGGDALPYLVNRPDPWTQATGEPVNGHKIGLSQVGAIYAASNGVNYREILEFYYPGTVLTNLNNPIPTPVPQPEPETKVLYLARVVTRNPLSLNIWSTTSKVKSKLRVPQGATVEVLREEAGGWRYISYQGVEGYADGQYLVKIDNSPVLYLAEVITRNPQSLNIWEQANKKKSLAKIPKGATIEVLQEIDQTWAKVRYGTDVGYVDRQYLKKK